MGHALVGYLRYKALVVAQELKNALHFLFSVYFWGAFGK